MSLFKILKGDSSRISQDVTAFHEGYAYLTPDDGGFYIDSVVSGANKRIRINPKSTPVQVTLTAAGWSNKKQTLSVTGVTANSNGLVSLAQTATDAQRTAAQAAGLRATGQGAGTITFEADEAPTVDLPVSVILFT